MPTSVTVCNASELAPGQAKLVEVGDKKIAVFNVAGTFYAVDDECTHQGGPLSEGEVDGTEVTCPWHGAVFNLETGEAVSPPADEAIACYRVRVENGRVEVEV